MAEARQNWIRWLAFQAFFLGVCVACFAQTNQPVPSPLHLVYIQSPKTGSLAVRLTDLHSVPLNGLSVVLHNRATGAQVHAITTKSGAFRFAALDAGEYTLEADGAQLGHGHLEGILVTGGAEARIQAALKFEPVAPPLLEARVPHQNQAAATPGLMSPPPVPSALPTVTLVIPALPIFKPSLVATIPAPNISSPQLTASIAAVPMRSMAPMPFAALLPTESAHPESQATLPGQAAPHFEFQPARGAPIAQEPAELETRSNPNEAVLAAARLQAFPVSRGFAPALDSGSVLSNEVEAALRVAQLQITPVMETEVEAAPVAGEVTTTVTAAQMQALPVSGRRWQEFLVDTPTANASVDSSQPSPGDAGQQSSEVTIDGANTSLVFGTAADSGTSDSLGRGTDQRSSVSQPWIGGRGPGVSEAAIRDVQTTAGVVEAEGMRSAGGRTSVRTQSGGESLHGQGFLFDRQNTWGARNPFTQWVQNTGSTALPNFTSVPFTPPDHEIVWGLGMGSEIRRRKVFWFGALDSYRRNDPGLATLKNPGEFFTLPEPTSPEVVLLSAQLGETQNQAYNDYLGIATPGYAPSGLEQLAAMLGPAPRTAVQWVGFGRIDWQATERHRFTLEGIGTDWHAPGGGLTRVSETYGSHSFGASQASQQWLLARWEAYLTPNLLAVTQGSAGRTIMRAPADKPSSFEQAFLNGNFWGQLPQIVVDSRYGFTIGDPSRFGQGSYPDERLYHGQEMLDWVYNKLLVKAGFEIDHNSDATSLLRNQTGTYYYSSVASFISDALAFQKFGLADALDPRNPHNCGATATKFGSQPCYSYYSQTMGPTDWHLSTNDWGSYVTTQWQASKFAVFSGSLRWELEQLPPPIAALANPDLPQTEKLPRLGNNWGPRVSVAIGGRRGQWPVLRLGYGMYFGRTGNATLETALTQTGSLHGDLNFFMRPSDDCQFCSGGSPPFPYVFAGQPASVVKPGAVEFAPNFRNSEVHQAVATIEESLPGRVEFTASAMLSLGRRLPISIDTNFDPGVNPGTITYSVKDPTGKGPIKATQITVPFYASWPSASSPTGTADVSIRTISRSPRS